MGMSTTSRSSKRSQKLPAYQLICDSIRRRIEAGELKTGAQIESERSLAEIFEVSPMTARQALKTLEGEGLVQRKLGAGTFVAPPRINFNRIVSFSEQMASRGLQPHSKILSAGVTDREDDICARLSRPSGTPLVKLERVRFGGGEPFAIEACYLVDAEFSGLRKSNLENRSLFDILRHEYGVALAYADEEVDATSADQRASRLLGVPAGSSLLRVRQLLYAQRRSSDSLLSGRVSFRSPLNDGPPFFLNDVEAQRVKW